MAQGLTPQQSKALEFIRSSDPSPTLQDIADHVGLASKSGGARLVDILVEKGFVERLPRAARGIRPVGPLANPEPWRTGLAARSTNALIKELNRRGFRVVDMRRSRRGADNEGLGSDATAASAQRLGSPP